MSKPLSSEFLSFLIISFIFYFYFYFISFSSCKRYIVQYVDTFDHFFQSYSLYDLFHSFFFSFFFLILKQEEANEKQVL